MQDRKNGRLAGKVTLVTGAASGFGRGIAERFAAEGARVAVVDLNGDGAATVAGGLGSNGLAIRCDVSDAADIAAAVAATIDRFGRLDIAVNNAGWSHPNQPVLDTDEASVRKLFDVNVMSIYHMTRAALPHWRATARTGDRETGTSGVMLNIGSTGGIRPRPGLSWYNASKGAVNTLTQSLAVELAPEGIRINAIAPVMGVTGLLETFMGMPDTPENRAGFIPTIPMGRLSQPDDIAAAAVYLVSDEAQFITGIILPVDGGRTI